MFIYYNENPCGISTIDCVIRAISIVTGMRWRKVYAGLCVFGSIGCTWGNVNSIWAEYMRYLGFTKYRIHKNGDYTVSDFSRDHPCGSYVLGTGEHAVAVVDGNYIDSWDSGDEQPLYYFVKE